MLANAVLHCLPLQLRERLSLLKVAEAEEEERRRREILSAKQVRRSPMVYHDLS